MYTAIAHVYTRIYIHIYVCFAIVYLNSSNFYVVSNFCIFSYFDLDDPQRVEFEPHQEERKRNIGDDHKDNIM